MSLLGGGAVIPHKKICLTRKASEVLKMLPTLFRLLTLSKIIINGDFLEDLKSSTLSLFNSLVLIFRTF